MPEHIAAETHQALIEALVAESHPRYRFNVKDSEAGRQALALDRNGQRAFVLTAVDWLRHREIQPYEGAGWAVQSVVLAVLHWTLPFEQADLLTLISWSIGQSFNGWRGIPQLLKAVDDYLGDHPLTPELQAKLTELVHCIEAERLPADMRQWLARLKTLSGRGDTALPLAPGEAWSDAALADVQALDDPARSAWVALLNACESAGGSAPTAKWLKTSGRLLEAIDFPNFKRAVLKWFPLVDKPRTQAIAAWSQWEPNPNLLSHALNADILKALIWLCAGRDDKDLARALAALAVSAYRKIPGVGPRCVRVGNACVWALGHMPGRESIAQLALLKIKVKFGTAQKGIAKALAAAAQQAGLPPDDIEEMSVPTYGLQTAGVRREQLGEFTADLTVTGTASVEVTWIKTGGKRQASTPPVVKEQFAAELKDLTQSARDIKKMLPAQRDRIENLYLKQKKWDVSTWRERYLDHPLLGGLARRLIWKFGRGDRAASGVWYVDRIVGRDGVALDWLDDATQVELWHPIGASSETVLAWRDWLAEHQVQQPFKQAHREIYLLTDAERNTRVYSNRFAAHILRQHQFNALCAARGWKNKLRLMVDDDYPPAMCALPAWGLRAEFWVEGAGSDYGVDTNQTGTYLHLATDQVRFYLIDARENYAHAGGGGYRSGRYGHGLQGEPLALESVPALVFSEIMRDVDLFVGVASLGNDPNWSDGGPQGRYRDYWSNYSFGDLSESAKTRQVVLERLLPRLKIAGRCALADRFLVVRGELRTYKIHLGSGNILMEPDDQYLCIVPARNTAGESLDGKVFLPFEGDQTLAIILSKAFLLAEDRKIKDPTIMRQLKC